ncbi:MAG TPA: hypothetical protein VMT62_08300 [Syntrophorhabdaceae bacterium]|nr:hypothetical protein [Syntrophorhabdaceae bacterium]
METFIGILKHTPWWVFLAFVYVLYAGIKATRPRRVPMFRLLIPPCIFTLLSLYTLIGRIGDHVLYILPWGLAIGTGIIIGWLESRRFVLVADKKGRHLQIPGSVLSFFLFLFFFGAQYYYGFMRATDPARVKGITFVVFMLLVSGLGTGIMWLRSYSYLLAYTRAR